MQKVVETRRAVQGVGASGPPACSETMATDQQLGARRDAERGVDGLHVPEHRLAADAEIGVDHLLLPRAREG